MKLIEKKQTGHDKSYLLSISRKEFRLLAASLNAVVEAAGLEGLAEVVPVSQQTIDQLMQEVNEALEARLTGSG